MRPRRARYAKIDQLSRELLIRYQITDAPIPVETIAKGEGASIVFEAFKKEISGLLLRTSTETIIAVEQGHPEARRRFTIAHELGHLLLHEGREVRVDKDFRVNLRSPESSTAEDIEEIEANAFAAAILMPEAFLRRNLASFLLDIDDEVQVKRLARRYGVSTQAITIRLVNLIALRRL